MDLTENNTEIVPQNNYLYEYCDFSNTDDIEEIIYWMFYDKTSDETRFKHLLNELSEQNNNKPYKVIYEQIEENNWIYYFTLEDKVSQEDFNYYYKYCVKDVKKRIKKRI